MTLVEEILSGDRRDLQLLAASGLVPLPPEQLLPLQVRLAEGEDAEVAERATTGIALTDPRRIAAVLATDADAATLGYFARTTRDSAVIETIMRRRDVPTSVVRELAPRLAADLQDALLLRQDLIVLDPELLSALESNPHLTQSSQRRIGEYREHLIGDRGATIEGLGEMDRPGYLDPEVIAEIEVVRAQAIAIEGEVDEVTGLSEGQIRMLPIPARLKLARGAPRSLRGLLVRDTNPQVALEVVRANALSDTEVEQLAKSRVVAEEILEEIVRRREWIRKYPVLLAIATNPKTPGGVAIRLIPQLAVRDLRGLARDRNVPDAVRQTAARIYRVKSA